MASFVCSFCSIPCSLAMRAWRSRTAFGSLACPMVLINCCKAAKRLLVTVRASAATAWRAEAERLLAISMACCCGDSAAICPLLRTAFALIAPCIALDSAAYEEVPCPKSVCSSLPLAGR
jgi:hypothetical protein